MGLLREGRPLSRGVGFRLWPRYRPVIGVSWDDAKAYVDWLSQQAQHTYRLLSEAEWESTTRAGTTFSRFWGDDPNKACEYGNVADQTFKKEPIASGWTIHDCVDGFAYTSPVGSFKPNAFGLYDMLGNVWQWTEDCWHDNYEQAPGDGKSWGKENGGDCGRRVIRGGSWDFKPDFVRSANRYSIVPSNRYNYLGFRVARTLP